MVDAENVLSEVFNIEKSQIPKNVIIDQLPGWDSLGHMRLVFHIEKVINRTLTTEEILSMVDAKHINKLLKSK